MLLRTFIAAKIHGLRVTDKALDYTGSATIPRSLMEAAGIAPYEQVHVVNKANGKRWVTYVLPGEEGEFVLNGAAARMGEVGDECLLFTYRQEGEFSGARVVFVDRWNAQAKVVEYAAAARA